MPFRLTDTEWVMIVVAAIYLGECACWVRREVLCLSTVLGRFRALPSPSFMGNERFKLVLGNPSPLARCFLAEPWPFAVSPHGIAFPQATFAAADGKAVCHLPFDAITGPIAAMEKEVRANGGTIAVGSSPEQAGRLAAMLAEVAAAGEADRGKVIGSHLDRWMDHAAARGAICRTEEVERDSAVFGLHALRAGLRLRPGLVLFAVVARVAAGVRLFRPALLHLDAHGMGLRRLPQGTFRREVFARFRHVGMLFLSPASAMRSPESLLRHGLAAFHPLAIAAALCTRPRCAALAGPMLLALEHPKPGELPGEPEACRIDAWFRKKLRKRLDALLRRLEIDPMELLRPAPPLGDSRSYCPRCRNQYVLAAGTCPDCGGLPLVAYAGEDAT